MNSKTITLLATILIVLLVVWQAQSWWQGRQLSQNAAAVQLDSGVNKDKVDKIVAQVKDKSFEFKKADNQWKLGDEKANAAKIDNLLGLLDKPKVELVSQKQERHAELGVSDDKVNKISYWQGDQEKYVLLFSSSDSKLVRQKDKQNVYRLAEAVELSEDKSVWIEPTPMPSLSPTPTKK